jgi:ABC-type branched-subunit amino acid transport system substrate-binding protein
MFKQAYGVRPGYYAEAAYVHAELVVEALKRLHGNATNPTAVIAAMKSTPIVAPRGPVKLNLTVDAPTQNIYVCKVENVNGTLEDVPIKTYPNVLPWGTLPYAVWQKEYATDSTSAPAS